MLQGMVSKTQLINAKMYLILLAYPYLSIMFVIALCQVDTIRGLRCISFLLLAAATMFADEFLFYRGQHLFTTWMKSEDDGEV
jgi:hypothetical protein